MKVECVEELCIKMSELFARRHYS